jgi:hypothetical protein
MYGGDQIKFNILVRIPEGKSIFMRLMHGWNDSMIVSGY